MKTYELLPFTWYKIVNLLYILRLLPVLEVFDVIDKVWILDVAPLGQEMDIVRVPQALHKFQLNLKIEWLG